MRRGVGQVFHQALDPTVRSSKFSNSRPLSGSADHRRRRSTPWPRCASLRCTHFNSGFSGQSWTVSAAACCFHFPTGKPARASPGWDYSFNLKCELPRLLKWCPRDLLTGPRSPSLTLSALGMTTSAMGSPPEGYRPNVGLCLVNEKNEVFVASRLDVPESWQMPQGGVDDGEDLRHAAIRELREETGVTSAELVGEVHEWLTYEFPPDVKEKIAKLWQREWIGQAQKWFLFRFTGNDNEIDLVGDGTEPPEFGNWKWLPAAEVVNKVVDFKKPVYTRAFKSLSTYVESWSKL